MRTVLVWVAACGSALDVVEIFDNGDGTCSRIGVSGETPCTGPIYGSKFCRSLAGQLKINIRRTSSAPYVQPNIQQSLNTLGIGNLVYIKTLTIVLNERLPNVVPAVSPNFLSSLVWVSLTFLVFSQRVAGPVFSKGWRGFCLPLLQHHPLPALIFCGLSALNEKSLSFFDRTGSPTVMPKSTMMALAHKVCNYIHYLKTHWRKVTLQSKPRPEQQKIA